MVPSGPELIALALMGAIAAVSTLSILDPERAFRLTRPFQLRDVEFTDAGRDLHIAGGAVALVLAWAIVGGLFDGRVLLAFVVLTTGPVLYRYRGELRSSPADS